MWEMKVKSWVTYPLMDVRTGRVQIHGVAFGGANAVAGVEVSTDGGQSWKKAGFVGPDFGRFAWRPFVLPAKLEPGTYTIARSEEHTSELQSLMRISYAVFCL